MRMQFLVILAVICLSVTLAGANSAPVVSNVTASQRGDDSKLVDIYYDLADAEGDHCSIWVMASGDGGVTWSIPV